MLFLFRILYQVSTNIIRSIMKDSLTIHISYKSMTHWKKIIPMTKTTQPFFLSQRNNEGVSVKTA